MYRSLLVPLDRSSIAEQALPLALSIARRANAWLDLVAADAGFADQSQFSHHFKRIIGVTPGQFPLSARNT